MAKQLLSCMCSRRCKGSVSDVFGEVRNKKLFIYLCIEERKKKTVLS